jgi:hypothetical protein
MEKKLEVRANTTKNRLYMIFAGFFSDDDMVKAVNKVIEEVSRLKPGFDIITDSSHLKAASPKGSAEIVRALTFMKDHGVRNGVRISGDDVISDTQLTRLTQEAGFRKKERSVAATIAEADSILDDMV